MESSKSRFWLVPLLVVLCLVAQPASVDSQCMVASSFSTGPNATFPSTILATILLSTGTAMCRAIVNNAYGCYPDLAPDTMTGTLLFASAMTATTMTMTMASCVWRCTCGTAAPNTITAGSLPVELMGFEISAQLPVELMEVSDIDDPSSESDDRDGGEQAEDARGRR